MGRYRLFILCFIISIIAMVICMGVYFSSVMSMMELMQQGGSDPDPTAVFEVLFSPALLISGLIAFAAGITYRVLGILFIAGNNRLEGGEKAIWIIGFVLAGFIAAIVFMAMATSRNLVARPSPPPFDA